MKKVLFVNHIAEITGAENSLLCLFRKLDRSQIQPYLACPAGGELGRAAAELDVKVYEIPLRRLRGKFAPADIERMFTNLPLVLDRLCTIIREENIDILHANSTSAQLYCGPAANLTGRRLCWNLRRVPLMAESHLQTAFSFTANKVIAVSDAVQQFATSFVPEARLVKIYNGIDLDFWNTNKTAESAAAFRRELGVAKDQPLIGMSSNFFPHKRHEDFIRAIPEVLKNFPQATFVLLGDDLFGEQQHYKKTLHEQARELQLGERLHFAGYRKDIRGALAALDIFVLPSSHESFGRSAIEAMAMGKPIIVADNAGPREIIEDGWSGVFVPINSPDKIADAICCMLTEPDVAREIGAVAAREVATRFDSAQIAAQHVELYNSFV